MPIDPNLDFEFSPAQKAAIEAGFDAIFAEIDATGVPVINLSPAERTAAQPIGEARLPYVQNAIENLLPQPEFDQFIGLNINAARAQRLLSTALYVRLIKSKIDQLSDRFTDLGINSESLAYESVRDSYANAERYLGKVSGADVFYEAIKPLFEGQGQTQDPTTQP